LNGGNDALARYLANSGHNPVDAVHITARINPRDEIGAKKPPEGGLIATGIRSLSCYW
jgi:hypothetical protein